MSRADPAPGDLVRDYRIEKNWSRKRLADAMHKSASWVSHIERGELALNDITTIGRLAALLGAPLHEFIEATLGPDAETARNRPHVEQLRLAIAGHPAPGTITAHAEIVREERKGKAPSDHAPVLVDLHQSAEVG